VNRAGFSTDEFFLLWFFGLQLVRLCVFVVILASCCMAQRCGLLTWVGYRASPLACKTVAVCAAELLRPLAKPKQEKQNAIMHFFVRFARLVFGKGHSAHETLGPGLLTWHSHS
jgi:hypothetical protein